MIAGVMAPLLGSSHALLMDTLGNLAATFDALNPGRFYWQHQGTAASAGVKTVGAAATDCFISSRFSLTSSVGSQMGGGRGIISCRAHNGTERSKTMGVGINSSRQLVPLDGISIYGSAGAVALEPDEVYVIQCRTRYGTTGATQQEWRLYDEAGVTLLESQSNGRNSSGGGAGDRDGRIGLHSSVSTTVPGLRWWDTVVSTDDWPDPTRRFWQLPLSGAGTDQEQSSGAHGDVDELESTEVVDTGDLVALAAGNRYSAALGNPLDASGLTVESVFALASILSPTGAGRVYLSDGTNRVEGADVSPTAVAAATMLQRDLAPGGGAWSFAELDALEAGFHAIGDAFDLYALAAYAWATGVAAGGGGGPTSNLLLLRRRREGY